MNLDESNLNLQSWQKIENYQGPVIASTPRLGIVRSLRKLLGQDRRNISRFRASIPARKTWRDHVKKAA
jgi:hypothetical protein